jgi:hypothetical protein
LLGCRVGDDGDSEVDWVCASLIADPFEIHQFVGGGVEADLKSLLRRAIR